MGSRGKKHGDAAFFQVNLDILMLLFQVTRSRSAVSTEEYVRRSIALARCRRQYVKAIRQGAHKSFSRQSHDARSVASHRVHSVGGPRS